MVDQKIEFRKPRDFGENLNDSFLFIRLNFKELIGSLFAICAVFMIAHAIMEGLFASDYNPLWNIFLAGEVFVMG